MSGLAEKTVAITGGTGFIGSRLAERLAYEEGARVRVLVHDWRRATWVSRSDVELVKGDVTEPATLLGLFRGAEVVFHCVGIGGSPEQCRAVNVEGTRNVVTAAREAGVRRVVYLSTVGVHGPTLADGMDESSPRRRLGHVYADSKIEAEEVFESLTSDGQVEGVIVRPTYVWGPNSNLFTLPFVRAIRKGQLFLVNRGTGACNAVYVDNVADLVILCGHHPRAPGNAFLVRDPDRHTWYDFFSHYARMLDRDPAEWRSVPSGWTPGRVVGMTLREPLSAAWRGLSRLVDRVEPASPTIARYVLKAPRKIIYRAKEAVDRLLPAPYGWWDLAKFSSPGFISQENSRRLLDFELRMTVREGMDETAVWLREQSHVPHSVTRSRSPAEAAR